MGHENFLGKNDSVKMNVGTANTIKKMSAIITKNANKFQYVYTTSCIFSMNMNANGVFKQNAKSNSSFSTGQEVIFSCNGYLEDCIIFAN